MRSHMTHEPTGCHAAECITLRATTPMLVLQKYRAVLMDQDVLHRLSAPSAAAGGRPRYSLVWKLALTPRPGVPAAQTACCIARPEWGRPTAFGSAAKLEEVVRQMARKRKAEERVLAEAES